MQKYNGKTVRLKGDKQKVVKNMIEMLTTENLNIERYLNTYLIRSSDIMYITEADEILNIFDKLYHIESLDHSFYSVKITENDCDMQINDILNVFMLCSINHTKQYIRDCDVTKYDFYIPLKYIASQKNNFAIEDYIGDTIIYKYEVKVRGNNNYSHDSSQKFPLNVLQNDIPRCVSPDWYLWKKEYIDRPYDNFYEKKQHVTNRRDNINEIQIQILEMDIEKTT